MIRETYRLTKENHRMLRIMRFEAWMSSLGHLVFWLALLFASLYTFQHYLAPYVANLPSAQDVQNALKTFKSLPNFQ